MIITLTQQHVRAARTIVDPVDTVSTRLLRGLHIEKWRDRYRAIATCGSSLVCLPVDADVFGATGHVPLRVPPPAGKDIGHECLIQFPGRTSLKVGETLALDLERLTPNPAPFLGSKDTAIPVALGPEIPGSFPDWAQCVVLASCDTPANIRTFGLAPELFARVAAVLEHRTLRFYWTTHYPSALSPILLADPNDPELDQAWGVLMPVRIE